MDRRVFLGAAFFLVWENATASAARCNGLQYFLQQTDNFEQSIDRWLRGEGYLLLPALEKKLDEVAVASRDHKLLVEPAKLEGFWTDLSQAVASLCAAIGVLGTEPGTLQPEETLHAVGFGLSGSMILVQIASAPVAIEAVELVNVDSASKAELVLSTFGPKHFALAYRAKGNELASQALAFLISVHTFVKLSKSRQRNVSKILAHVTKMQIEAIELRSAITLLREPGNLKPLRLQQLAKLRERISANLQKCDVMVAPPG